MTPDRDPAKPGTPPTEDALEARNAGADLALIASVIVTGAVYRLPAAETIAWPLILLSTLAHELGHGITALLVGGKFHSLLINEDASGVAQTTTASDFQHALVCAGGLVGPACAAALLFALARRDGLARASLVAMAVALLACVPVLLVGTFGKVFVAAVALAFLLIGARAPAWLARYALAFVAVQLALSVYSRGDYLFTRVAQMATGDLPSDVETMSRCVGLPYWFWGGVCGAFSVVVLLVGARLFLRGLGRAKPARTAVPAPSAPEAAAPERRVVPGSPAAEIEKMIQRLKQPERPS